MLGGRFLTFSNVRSAAKDFRIELLRKGSSHSAVDPEKNTTLQWHWPLF